MCAGYGVWPREAVGSLGLQGILVMCGNTPLVVQRILTMFPQVYPDGCLPRSVCSQYSIGNAFAQHVLWNVVHRQRSPQGNPS